MKKWLKCMPFLGLASLTLLTACNADAINWNNEVLGEAMVDPIDDNYRVFYQIFPSSFSDSNGDGIGDLQGIINRLDYLNDGNVNSGKSLGIQGIWLNPIFKSPSYHKYDVSDYETIDPDFGDLDTFKKLINECHKRNIKVILDLVLNHTSSNHQWFREFKKAQKNNDTNNKYYNYYSYFSKEDKNKAVTYQIDGTNKYYEGNFSSDMPELNFDNPEVYNDMVNIAKTWIDNGADGFRFDAARYIYYGNTEKNVEFWNKYCKDIKSYAKTNYNSDLYTVAEVWDSSITRKPYHTAVNTFDFSFAQTEGTAATFCKRAKGNNYSQKYVDELNEILSVNPNAMHIPFLSNHDLDRSAGFLPLSKGYAQMAANLLILSSGSPFIYYGEEIGMKGSRGSSNTDANRRLAMLWGDNDTVKNPEGADYKDSDQINGTVKSQVNSKTSLLTRYRKLIQIRNKHPEIARGSYEAIKNDKDLAIFKVTYNDSTIYIIHNASTNSIDFDISSYGNKELLEQIGAGESTVNENTLTIAEQSSVIIK